MTIEILNWALEVSSEPCALEHYSETPAKRRACSDEHRRVLCDVTGKWCEAEIHDRAVLRPGDVLDGPALIIEPQTTTFVSRDFSAQVDGNKNIWLDRRTEGDQ